MNKQVHDYARRRHCMGLRMDRANNGRLAMVRRAAVALGRPRGGWPEFVRTIQPGQNDLSASAPREPRSWRVLVLSSGELPVDAKLSEAPGRKARAGQLVRLLDVPAERGAGFGVFDNGGPDGDAGALAKSIKLTAIDAFGTAGPEFVRRLIVEAVTGDDVCGLISNFVDTTIPAAADGQVHRAAQRFGLIFAAGELATIFGIVPWPAGAARNAAAWALARWIKLRGGTEAAEARQALECVRLFIEQYGDARFEPIDVGDARLVASRAGYRKGNGAEREWWVLPEVWRTEICAGQDPQFVAGVLAERGILRTQAEKLQAKVRVGAITLRCYVLTASIFDGATDAA
jgi:putative DNA primase/helicase